jgi:hypothetical protein
MYTPNKPLGVSDQLDTVVHSSDPIEHSLTNEAMSSSIDVIDELYSKLRDDPIVSIV